jgi:hypothetical protein
MSCRSADRFVGQSVHSSSVLSYKPLTCRAVTRRSQRKGCVECAKGPACTGISHANEWHTPIDLALAFGQRGVPEPACRHRDSRAASGSLMRRESRHQRSAHSCTPFAYAGIREIGCREQNLEANQVAVNGAAGPYRLRRYLTEHSTVVSLAISWKLAVLRGYFR